MEDSLHLEEKPDIQNHLSLDEVKMSVTDYGVPRFEASHNDEHIDDSSLNNKTEGDSSSTSDSEVELRLEDLLNSSDTNALLNTLHIKVPFSEEYSLDSQISEKPLQGDVLLDEFPLFDTSHIGNGNIIDEEFRITVPERTNLIFPEEFFHGIVNDTSSAEDFIHGQNDESSPITRKTQKFQNSKSKIPLPIAQIEVRRSKRLMRDPDEDRKKCTPKNLDIVLKPSIKQRNTPFLNMIVDSSSGQLHEATKFATDLNSVNCKGIPFPEEPGDLVTIGIQGARKSAKNPKTALVKAVYYNLPQIQETAATVGFYSESQYKKYCTSPSKIIKTATPKKVKKLRWACELEW